MIPEKECYQKLHEALQFFLYPAVQNENAILRKKEFINTFCDEAQEEDFILRSDAFTETIRRCFLLFICL